jgi:glycosyltransferase involved in cell wall biosynthesis
LQLALNHPLGRLGINWQLSEFHGWGVFGLNVALNTTKFGYEPIRIVHQPNIDPAKFPTLEPAIAEWAQNQQAFQNPVTCTDTTMLHSLGNDFALSGLHHRGKRNIGFIFFETTLFSQAGLERAQSLDLVIAGSRWNAQVLANMGIKKVAYVMQGVNTERFSKSDSLKKPHPDKFVIFSGGKLEFRKGQDIALAAFKIFHQKHPDSVLMTAWHNPWPAISQDLALSSHGFGTPNIENNHIDIAEWCSRSGLPESAFIHIDRTPNEQMPLIYAQADVALFPNRAEGGTNLVAMEVMAAGVPCILSANTGHIDLIAKDNCYHLTEQTGFTNASHQGWGQSSVDEIVSKLELAYQNRDELAQIGKRGQSFIEQFTWENQTRQLIECCSDTY